jgi:hypothetical protein
MKKYLLRCYWLLNAQFGIDPIKFIRSFRGLPRFLRDLRRFRTGYSGTLELLPCLHDWYEEAGTTRDEYFWQDLIVARLIFTAKPEKHVDIGSRVDGFVAHIASFREIEVFDIRPITSHIPGVIFKQADLMGHDAPLGDYCDSLSCLHALEHFGLGRYGDPVDPKGYESGLRNMSRILRKGGYFYLSVPIGMERVEFNANRVFDPRTIIDVAAANQLEIHTLMVFTADKGLRNVEITHDNLADISRFSYGLGIFTFIKI